MAKLEPEFERRGVKVIGLSVDATTDHEAWARDIEETQGARPKCPIIEHVPDGLVTANHRVATPVNWKQSEDVIIAGSVSNDEARQIFGSWKEPKPYIRIVPQPS